VPLDDQSPHPDTAAVLAVFVGRPRVIGEVRGRPVESGIAKQRVAAASLALGETNLAGDRQADLSVHGGPDMAVYAYASEHYRAWQADGFTLDVGGVGENVALAGVTEHDVRLGDVWRWGGALVQVSQPRAPCYKLALHIGRKDVGPRMIETRRVGWYLRVLEPGEVPTSGPFTLVDRVDDAPTIHETFGVMFDGADGHDSDVLERVLRSPALPAAWREPLVARRGDVPS
jgi:MOSC domain-containing protein YiiM